MQITIYNIPYIFPATFMYRKSVLWANTMTTNKKYNISISVYQYQLNQYFELHLLSRSLYWSVLVICSHLLHFSDFVFFLYGYGCVGDILKIYGDWNYVFSPV